MGSARASRAVFRARAENNELTKNPKVQEALCANWLDAGRVQQHPMAGVLPNSSFRVYSLCGISMVLPPMNSRITASPGMRSPVESCCSVNPSTDSSSALMRS